MLDAQALSDDQRTYVDLVVTKAHERIETLTQVERAIFSTVWTMMARASAPVVVRNLNFGAEATHQALTRLIELGLLWFDTDLRAALQCPPFSVLSTPHRVKAFGWDVAHTCSFIDIPLTLLLYGPNTWLSAQSTCPRSGENLTFRVLMDERGDLRLDAPASAQRWRIWMPEVTLDGLTVGTSGTRSRINAFFTRADLDTYLHYHPSEHGSAFTLEQAIYLSQSLLGAYRQVLPRRV